MRAYLPCAVSVKCSLICSLSILFQYDIHSLYAAFVMLFRSSSSGTGTMWLCLGTDCGLPYDQEDKSHRLEFVAIIPPTLTTVLFYCLHWTTAGTMALGINILHFVHSPSTPTHPVWLFVNQFINVVPHSYKKYVASELNPGGDSHHNNGFSKVISLISN